MVWWAIVVFYFIVIVAVQLFCIPCVINSQSVSFKSSFRAHLTWSSLSFPRCCPLISPLWSDSLPLFTFLFPEFSYAFLCLLFIPNMTFIKMLVLCLAANSDFKHCPTGCMWWRLSVLLFENLFKKKLLWIWYKYISKKKTEIIKRSPWINGSFMVILFFLQTRIALFDGV